MNKCAICGDRTPDVDPVCRGKCSPAAARAHHGMPVGWIAYSWFILGGSVALWLEREERGVASVSRRLVLLGFALFVAWGTWGMPWVGRKVEALLRRLS